MSKMSKNWLPFLLGTRKTNERPLIHPSKDFWPPSCQALNLDITLIRKRQGTGKILRCNEVSLYIKVFFSIYFTITGLKKFVRYAEDFAI